MILEIAQIHVRDGLETEFEAAVSDAAAIFRRAKGCHGFELRRSVERPMRYTLLVRWETVEAHTIGFQRSGDFAEWRRLVQPFFVDIPEVEHTRQVVQDGLAEPRRAADSTENALAGAALRP